MNHYNLLFNGCNFTYGSYLSSNFSRLVSERLDKSYINLSDHGVSNDWIIENTINWFESGNSCDFAIIQFTVKSRIIWYDKNKTAFNFAPALLTNKEYLNSDYLEHLILSGAIEPLRSYYTKVHSDYSADQNFYKNLFLLQNYLNINNIPHLFLSACKVPSPNKGWQDQCKGINIQHIVNGPMTGHPIGLDDVDTSLIGNPETNPDHFINNSINRPSDLAHQKIAEYIIDNIVV